jgi:hypothetical protein
MMSDFENKFDKLRKERDLQVTGFKILIGLIFLVTLITIILTAYLLDDSTLEDIGRFFGKIVSGFNKEISSN